jgi:phage FluMu gp28-like protein
MHKINREKLSYKLGATFDYQQAVIKSKARYRKIVKARQIGMTTALAIEKLIDTILFDDYVSIIVSPSARQSQRMMRYVKKAFVLLEKQLDTRIPVQKWTNEEVYFHHGSEIHSLPNNPKAIQGFDCDDGTVDEAGLFTTQEGEDIVDALVGSLAAKQGKLTLSGRPRGKRGLLWSYFDPTNPRGKDFESYKITWKDRAKQDEAYGKEVEKHKRILTKLQFAEIYDAEFVDEGVLIFPHELLEAAQNLWRAKRYILMPPEGTPKQDTLKYVGIDFGRKRNLTEIHILEKMEEKLFRTLAMRSLVQMNFEDQKSYIDDMIARVKPTKVKIDERGMGLALLDYLQRKHGESLVEPLKMSERKSKEKIILQLRNHFTDLKLAIPDNDKLYEQLHAFQKDYTPAGNVVYSGKVDETDFLDDKVIALAAAVDAAQSKPFDFGVV